MDRNLSRLLDRLDDGCPQCGEEPTDAQLRGTEVVLVPCGHVVSPAALSRLQVPEGYSDGQSSP